MPTYSVGYDLSYPQCQLQLPTPAAFAIVGVNGGTAFTSNQCMKRELAWAAGSTGAYGAAPVALYVNTGDPGMGSKHWPKSNRDLVTGQTVTDRYGRCHGGNTNSCAWQYGWNAAENGARRRGITTPGAYAWWLDVESGNAWQATRSLNRADLTGMTDYFLSSGLKVGIYSTAFQWPRIAGVVPPTNPLTALPEWVTGASNQLDAETACWQAQFMSGGNTVLSQWYTSSSSIDVDVTCPASGFRRIRSPE